MPREFVILSPTMPGDAPFRAAAVEFGEPVSLTLDAGGLLARFSTPAHDPLLTVLHPRLIRSIDEMDRLLPGHPPLPDTPDLWWTDAVAPWAATQDLAFSFASALARQLRGVLCDLAAEAHE